MKRNRSFLRRIGTLPTALLSILLFSCTEAEDGQEIEQPLEAQSGYLIGEVRDSAGKPLQGVRILVDHSIFFNSNITTSTDAHGRYKVAVPRGSWYAFAMHQVSYGGENFTFYLHPEDERGFGEEGGVRNFTWKLSGTRPQPLSGNYGALVTLDNFPGVYIQVNEIDFAFTPLGPLVDGSTGKTLVLRTNDSYTLTGIPLGRYRLTASYHGRPLEFRRWNSEDEFATSFEVNFKSQIPGQCDNCLKLEYYWQ
jgi:hypothetical protein